MPETETNRRWLIESRLQEKPAPRADRDAETLLYYKSQLEAELSYVQRELAALGVPAAVGT